VHKDTHITGKHIRPLFDASDFLVAGDDFLTLRTEFSNVKTTGPLSVAVGKLLGKSFDK
jgi:hypothetical protein